MKALTRAVLAAATVLSSTGCEAKRGSVAAAMAKMEEFQAAMCRCSDAPCVDQVSQDMTRWSQAFARTADKDVKIDDATTRRMVEITTKLSECSQRFEPPPGAAEVDAAPAPTRPGPAEREPPAVVPAEVGDLPGECARVKAGIAKLATCDRIPRAARDAMTASGAQMLTAWAAAPAMSAETNAAFVSGCAAAADAIDQATSVCN